MPALINIAAYQTAWFACVLGAAHQVAWIGTLTAVATTTLHVLRSDDRGAQLKLIGIAVLLGFVVDSSLLSADVIRFSSGQWLDVTPHWMLALWLAFATTFTVSLRWLIAKPLWAIVFGALGGPLAYYAGMQLGAMSIPSLTMGLVVIGIAWAVAMGVISAAVPRVMARSAVAREQAA